MMKVVGAFLVLHIFLLSSAHNVFSYLELKGVGTYVRMVLCAFPVFHIFPLTSSHNVSTNKELRGGTDIMKMVLALAPHDSILLSQCF